MLAGPIVAAFNYHWFLAPLVLVVIRRSRRAVRARSPITSPGKVNWTGAALLGGVAGVSADRDQRGAVVGMGQRRTLGLTAAGLC